MYPTSTLQPAEPRTQKKEFINYIHNFRGLAIIFVVAGHLLLNWAKNDPVHLFFRVLWENGTVLFIFIAGYLFQHLSKKFEYRSYLTKKVQNVLIPYLIVSIPIIIYRVLSNDIPGYLLALQPDFISWPVIQKVGFFMITGAHLQPLWFVPMITLFYLVAPLLIYIDRHPKLYYLLPVFCLVSILIEREPMNMIPKMFIHFFSVYLFGMFLSRYKKEYLEWAKKNWVVLSVVTLLAFGLNVYFADSYFNKFSYVHKMLFCCFFIYWLWKLDRYIPKFMTVLAEVSFGIFFLHYYFLLIIKAVYEKTMKHPIPGNVLYWIVDLVLVMGATILFIKIVQKIFGKKSRYLIGC